MDMIVPLVLCSRVNGRSVWRKGHDTVKEKLAEWERADEDEGGNSEPEWWRDGKWEWRRANSRLVEKRTMRRKARQQQYPIPWLEPVGMAALAFVPKG